MVDADRAARLLRGIEERLDQLNAERHADDVTRSQTRWLNSIKYLFVTAIEGSVDVAHHVAASERWAAPETNADAFRVLERNGVIDNDLAAAMALAAGFRNVLVHQYAVVEDARVIAFLDELDTIRQYVEAVSVWIVESER